MLLIVYLYICIHLEAKTKYKHCMSICAFFCTCIVLLVHVIFTDYVSWSYTCTHTCSVIHATSVLRVMGNSYSYLVNNNNNCCIYMYMYMLITQWIELSTMSMYTHTLVGGASLIKLQSNNNTISSGIMLHVHVVELGAGQLCTCTSFYMYSIYMYVYLLYEEYM